MGIRTTMVTVEYEKYSSTKKGLVLDKSGKQRHQGFLAWIGVGECGEREEPKRILGI